MIADACLTAQEVQFHNGLIAAVVGILIVAALAHLFITWQDSKGDRDG